MIKKIFLIFGFIAIVSCGNDKSDDIYKTKSGEYASRTGNFIAEFPTEPNYSAIDNQIGLDKFKIHNIKSSLGPKKFFTVEYIDYPEHMIKSMSDEQIFEQSINAVANKLADNFVLINQKPIEQNGLLGKSFQLESTDAAKSNGYDAFVLGRLFRDGNRIYTVSYAGVNDKNAGSFVDSFRLLK
jgi:hypothetical protein